MRRILSITAVAALAVGAQVALGLPARADTTTTVAGGELAIQALAGRANNITLSLTALGDVQVTDLGDAVLAGAGCAQMAADTAVCAGVTRVRAALGDLDDRLDNTTALPSIVRGEAGSDTLIGGADKDELFGGDQNDVINGRGGNDRVFGDGGDDAFWAEATADGADTYFGGAGTDTATYQARTVLGVRASIDGDPGDGETGENDNLGNDVENLTGTTFGDTLLGNIGQNTIVGLGGMDTLIGQPGNDQLAGGDSDDRLAGGDGADLLTGGPGTDAMLGGNNNDTLNGVDLVNGNDTLNGDLGADTCTADPGDVLISC